MPDAGSTWFIHRLLGFSRAFEWMVSNRRLSADEALIWGLVSEDVPHERFAKRVAELAEWYAALPTRAVAMTKQLFEHAYTASLEEQLELEAELQQAATRDARTSPRACRRSSRSGSPSSRAGRAQRPGGTAGSQPRRSSDGNDNRRGAPCPVPAPGLRISGARGSSSTRIRGRLPTFVARVVVVTQISHGRLPHRRRAVPDRHRRRRAPRGATILDKRRDALERLDHVRRLLVHEPRGHADMYGCFVVEPNDAGADLGVVFFHNAGYSTACGHGTIALVTWALDEGVVERHEGENHVVVDVPSGRLETWAHVEDGRVRSVRFRNVPVVRLGGGASSSATARSTSPSAAPSTRRSRSGSSRTSFRGSSSSAASSSASSRRGRTSCIRSSRSSATSTA